MSLTSELLPREEKGHGTGLVRSMAKVALLGGLGFVGLMAVGLPEGTLKAGAATNLRASSPEVVTGSVPTWWHLCEDNGKFCDMRRNVKDEVSFESHWAYTFLSGLSPETCDLYLSFFHGYREHILKTKATRDPSCLNFQSWDDAKAYWEKQGLTIEKNGRSVANYADSLFVAFKPAEDATHKNFPDCSWNAGEPGWGADSSKTELAIKGGHAVISKKARVDPNATFKFMWTQAKGRGLPEDKAAMSLDVNRYAVSASMGSEFTEQFGTNKGETDEQREMPEWKQRLLPGASRWDATFKNDNLGDFSYGDGGGWIDAPDARHFFYNRNVHGFSIWPRNLTLGNPADRMRHVGMPWIGGASGSLIDFYLGAHDLGYRGKDFGDIMLVHMAALVAGGHHSLGELLIAATEADRTGGEMSFEKDNKTFSYFAGPQFGHLLDIMNKPQTEWAESVKALGAGGLPTLYAGAMGEFMSRAGSVGHNSDFKRGVSTVDKMRARNPPSNTKKCLDVAGVDRFRKAVFNLGGPKRALESWQIEGLTNFAHGLSPEVFVMKLGPACYSRAIVYTTAAFKEMADSKGTVTKRVLDAYVDGKRGGTPALVQFLTPLRKRIGSHLWYQYGDWSTKSEAEFTEAVQSSINKELMDVHECLVSATGAVRDRVGVDAFESFYAMAWLA